MAERVRENRRGDLSNDGSPTLGSKLFPRDPSAPATAEDKLLWKGFCEIESEPVGIPVIDDFHSHRKPHRSLGFLQCHAQEIRCSRRQGS